MTKGVFIEEETLIDEYRLKIKDGLTNGDDLEQLLIRYEELLREMKCLTRVSDRLQWKLESVIANVKNQNKKLETTVESTTKDLEKKISTLDRYRFDLSHKFRVPIAVLLGILELIDNHSVSQKENLRVFKMIKQTSLQIDDVIKDLDKQFEHS